MNIGFIGAGNMGGALARAISQNLEINVYIFDKMEEKGMTLASEIGGKFASFEAIAKTCGFIFLGVKPNGISDVCSVLGKLTSKESVVISMAAGVKIEKLEEALKAPLQIIRIMPNTPVAVGEGLTAYAANSLLTKENRDVFESFMTLTGTLVSIPEEEIDAFSAISGCGPAYAYMFIDALVKGGERCGLTHERAKFYAASMLRGAAKMTLASDTPPSILKDNVCSPGGSTIEGVKVLDSRGFEDSVSAAISAAYKRTCELGK